MKSGWVVFDKNGDRIDCSGSKISLSLGSGSSWRSNHSIYYDKFWNMSIDEVLDNNR